jgi:hypothetical protein
MFTGFIVALRQPVTGDGASVAKAEKPKSQKNHQELPGFSQLCSR